MEGGKSPGGKGLQGMTQGARAKEEQAGLDSGGTGAAASAQTI